MSKLFSRTLRFHLPVNLPYWSDKKSVFWMWPRFREIIKIYASGEKGTRVPVEVILRWGPTDRYKLFCGYRMALLLTSAARWFDDWVECRDLKFWHAKEEPPPGYPWHHRMLWPFQTLGKRIQAFTFTWIARNGDDWSWLYAGKTSICIALGLEYDHRREKELGPNFYSADLAWWGTGDSFWHASEDPRSWVTVKVATGWNRWWYELVPDSSDVGCS